MAQIINLNDTSPTAPANALNVRWQKGATSGTDPATGTPIYPASANVPAATATTLGLVKPGAGIAIDGSGALSIAGLTVNLLLGSGIVATNVARRQLVPHASQVSECAVIVEASDAAIALTFRIKLNGVDIFVADPSIAAASAAGAIFHFTNLTAVPLALAKDDVLTLDVTSGSASWDVTIYLRT